MKVSVHNFANPQYLPISSKAADLTFDLKVSVKVFVHNLTCFNPQISSYVADFKFDSNIDLKILN